jgi:hypothetical protein
LKSIIIFLYMDYGVEKTLQSTHSLLIQNDGDKNRIYI